MTHGFFHSSRGKIDGIEAIIVVLLIKQFVLGSRFPAIHIFKLLCAERIYAYP